jgi:methylase of polypeptide subunit release factors
VDATFVAWHTACESNPIDFALRSAEFTISRAWIGNSIYVPAIDEKLLVVYFTLRNPQAADRYVQWGTLRFSAVDSSGNAWDSVTDT